MKQHDAPAIAVYVNWRGRTVRQIREEAALYDALENYVDRNHGTLHGLRPRELHEKLRALVNAEQSAGRLTLSKEGPTPIGWQIKHLLHMSWVPLLGLLLCPLLLVAAPFYTFAILPLEKTDSEVVLTPHQKHS